MCWRLDLPNLPRHRYSGLPSPFVTPSEPHGRGLIWMTIYRRGHGHRSRTPSRTCALTRA